MSLRARLIAVLLAVAAAGLLLLAGITYALLRSYELQRVDDQARSAIPLMERILDGDELGPGPARASAAGRRPTARCRPAPTASAATRRAVTARRQITLGGPAPSPPELPAELPAGPDGDGAGAQTATCATARSPPADASPARRSSWPCRSPRWTGRSTACCWSRGS